MERKEIRELLETKYGYKSDESYIVADILKKDLESSEGETVETALASWEQNYQEEEEEARKTDPDRIALHDELTKGGLHAWVATYFIGFLKEIAKEHPEMIDKELSDLGNIHQFMRVSNKQLFWKEAWGI